MKNSELYPAHSSHEYATEMNDGDELRLHMSNLDPVAPVREESATAPVETAPKNAEIPPHHIPRQVTNGIIRLRVIHQYETTDNATRQSWNSFEATR